MALGLSQQGAIHVIATDADPARASGPIGFRPIAMSARDTIRARFVARDASQLPPLVPGDVEIVVMAWPHSGAREHVRVRAGFRDTLLLRLGWDGQECAIAPDRR